MPLTTRYGEVTNPATGNVVRHVPLANAADVDAAVAAAAAAFPAWRAHPPLRRARILMRFRELMDKHQKDLARIVTEEHGKTLTDAEGSRSRAASKSSSSPPAFRICSRANSAKTWVRTSTVIRCASRSAFAPASRRSTFRRWFRCGCSRWRLRAATPSC